MKRLIFDGNNNLFRSSYRAANRFGQKDPVWNSITVSTFLFSVRSLAAQFLPDSVIVVWDGGRSIRRRLLYPAYKQQRSEKLFVDDMKRVMEDINFILNSLKCRIISMNGREADDVISLLVRKCPGNNIIVSDDSDYFQLISNGAKVFKPLSSQCFSKLNFREIFGVNPRQHLVLKSVVGDTSDNIKGVTGVGPKTMMEIFRQFNDIKTVDELMEASLSDTFVNNKRVKLIVKEIDQIRRNFELLDTDKEIFTESEIQILEDRMKSSVKFDENEASSKLFELGAETILQFFTEWSTPFRSLR